MSATQSIKVEFDPTQPVGVRHVGVGEDGPLYEEMTLQEAVIERAAQILAEQVEANNANLKSIAEEVGEKLDQLLAERLPGMVDEALAGELVVTDSWGGERKRGTLRELIVGYVEAQLVLTKRGSYSNETALSKAVREEIDRALGSELVAAVRDAKEKLTARVQEKASEVIAQSVMAGLR